MNTRLSVEEELHLVDRARAGDREAEARLVICHLPPAYSLVNRYARYTAVPKEDLEQEAALALVTAVRKFDPTRGVRFVSYAMWWVRVRVQRTCQGWRYLSQEPPADNVRWIENMPDKEPPPPSDGIDLRVLRELSPRRRTAVELVLGLNGHEPHTRPELAEALGVRLGAANKLYSRAIGELRRRLHRCGEAPRRAA
jgi:RNA polymerase sigma factor (sigma-70 family)